MESIQASYPVVFGGSKGSKPHAERYRKFSQSWGYWKIIHEMADGSPVEINYIEEQYLSEFLFWLTFAIQKGEADKAEDEFQEQIRKSKRY